jgi:hypothetical protein
MEAPPTNVELNKKLKNAIATIDRKLKKLGVSSPGEARPYKIGNPGSFKYNELDSNTVNIHNAANLNYLLKAHAMLSALNTSYKATLEKLELEYTPCIWCNLPAEDWIHDLEIQIKIVANQTTILTLQKAKEELYGFLSNEDKLFNTLSKLKDIL